MPEEKQAVVISLPQVAVLDEVQIVLSGHLISGEKQVARRCFEFLNQAEYTSAINQYDRNMLTAYQELTEQIKKQKKGTTRSRRKN